MICAKEQAEKEDEGHREGERMRQMSTEVLWCC